MPWKPRMPEPGFIPLADIMREAAAAPAEAVA
jgi:hypothetical protein